MTYRGNMEKIKVFLSDPQILFREGMHFVLSGEEEFEVTGETTANTDALASIEANPPRVAILALADAGLDGAEAVRRIRRNLPSVAVVLTLEEKETEAVFAAITSGASACLDKDAGPDDLLDLVRMVARGGLPSADELLLPGIASLVLDEFEALAVLNERLDNLLANLSPRETQLLNDIASGNGILEAASNLKISEEAARNSLKVVLNKLAANDQARTVLEAAHRGMKGAVEDPAVREARRADFITRAEFRKFQEKVMASLKSVIGGRVPK
jgi:two-component system NarL family response regulator